MRQFRNTQIGSTKRLYACQILASRTHTCIQAQSLVNLIYKDTSSERISSTNNILESTILSKEKSTSNVNMTRTRDIQSTHEMESRSRLCSWLQNYEIFDFQEIVLKITFYPQNFWSLLIEDTIFIEIPNWSPKSFGSKHVGFAN